MVHRLQCTALRVPGLRCTALRRLYMKAVGLHTTAPKHRSMMAAERHVEPAVRGIRPTRTRLPEAILNTSTSLRLPLRMVVRRPILRHRATLQTRRLHRLPTQTPHRRLAGTQQTELIPLMRLHHHPRKGPIKPLQVLPDPVTSQLQAPAATILHRRQLFKQLRHPTATSRPLEVGATSLHRPPVDFRRPRHRWATTPVLQTTRAL